MLRFHASGGGIPAPEQSFTGRVLISEYARRAAPSALVAAIVDFEPGSRTAWKVNPAGQTLVVLSGEGRVQTDGSEVIEVGSGDVLWFEPGERHWEGASPEGSLTYLALQEEPAGCTVQFLEPVSDATYGSLR